MIIVEKDPIEVNKRDKASYRFKLIKIKIGTIESVGPILVFRENHDDLIDNKSNPIILLTIDHRIIQLNGVHVSTVETIATDTFNYYRTREIDCVWKDKKVGKKKFIINRTTVFKLTEKVTEFITKTF